jgi:hypothetical protein
LFVYFHDKAFDPRNDLDDYARSFAYLKFQVYNELVCNCHEDSKLLDVIHLVEKVYLAQTQTAR